MDKKRVSIVIPNYNGRHLLENNLPFVVAAARSYDQNTEIIVVDDGSKDDSIKYLKEYYPDVTLVISETNNGFSTACNLGVNKASGQIIVLLNTDVRPDNNFLTPLVNDFSDKNIFAIGCLDKSLEDDKEIFRGRGIGKFSRGFLIHARGEIDKKNSLWVSGGSSAFDKKKWMELGGFDEIYNPFYWEDIDLSYRAQKKGLVVLFEPKAVVRHIHEEGAIKNIYSKDKIKTFAYRNQFIFIWKNITDIKLILELPVWLPLHILKALLSKDTAFITGLFQALIKLPRIFYYRATVRGNSAVTDRKIVEKFQEEFYTAK